MQEIRIISVTIKSVQSIKRVILDPECLQVNLDEVMQLRRKEASFMPDSLLC